MHQALNSRFFNQNRKGFSIFGAHLLLFVFVLLALGAWFGAAEAFQERDIIVAEKQIEGVVQNIRVLYSREGRFPDATPRKLPLSTIAPGIYPPEMFDGANGAKPQTPWRTPLEFQIADGESFWLITPSGVTPDICGEILSYFVGPQGDPGVVGVWRSDNAIADTKADAQGARKVKNPEQAKDFCEEALPKGSRGFGVRFLLKA